MTARMRFLTIGSLIFAGLALGMLLAATIIQPAHAKGFEVGAYGGLNYSTDFGGSVTDEPIFYLEKSEAIWSGSTTTFSVGQRDGYVVGLTLGTDLDQVPGLSIGLDGSYRRNNLRGLWAVTYDELPPEEGPLPAIESIGMWDGSSQFQGVDQTTALLATARYGYKVDPRFELYASAGAGVAHRSLEFGEGGWWSPSFKGDETGFAWSLGAGAAYEVAPKVKVSLGYQHFSGPSISGVVNIGWTEIPFNADGENDSVTLGLAVAFD